MLRASSAAALESAVMERLIFNADLAAAAARKKVNVPARLSQIRAHATVTPEDRASFVGFFGPVRLRRAREIRYVTVRSPKLARLLYLRLSVGGDAAWCVLAYRYSLDHGSRDRCGTSLITNGMLVAPLDHIVFSSGTNVTSLEGDGGYWTVIEPISGILRGGTAAQVKQLLLVQRRIVASGLWQAKLARSACTGAAISYRKGDAPQSLPPRRPGTTPAPCWASGVGASS